MLAANPFIARLYPNFRGSDTSSVPFRPQRDARPYQDRPRAAAPRRHRRFAEAICRRAYGSYLRRRAASWRSADQVRLQPDYLKLHSHSHRQSILERFDRAVCDALRRAGITVPEAVGT